MKFQTSLLASVLAVFSTISTTAAALPEYRTTTPLDPTFDRDVRDTHLIYDYNAFDSEGNPEKWRYEIWFYSETRVVYAIHGGPMAGRKNYQTAAYQCVRPGQVWQVNWLEETGTIVSLVYDVNKTVSGLLGFSQGHWENPEAAHGDKRNPVDLERWRELAVIGNQTERFILTEKADIVDIFKGKGELGEIDPNGPTF
ncbi:hypothetical protein ACJ41O_005777 [Fusarium nematophilum]